MIECKLGCGEQIYHVPVRFSDGLEILIPRESANSIHYCDFLGPDDSTPTNLNIEQCICSI